METLLFTLPSIGAGAGTAVTAGSALSGLATAGSIIGAIQGGRQQAAVSKAQSTQAMLAAKQEELKGREQADNIRRSLQATLASQRAAFASRGISLASGTPVNLGGISSTNAARDIETAQFGAGQAAAANRAQAAQYKIEGNAARTASYAKAAGSLIQYGT